MRARSLLCRAALLTMVSAACGNDSSQPAQPGAPSPPASLVTANDNEVGIAQTAADLALTKVADRNTVRPGEDVTFTITLTNLGPDAATNVTFGDPVPDQLDFVSITCSEGGATVSRSFCTVASVASGASVTATLVVSVITNPVRSDRRFENGAFVTSDTPDPNSSNNTASVQMHIIGRIP